jgi:membrane protein YdbS with pleckstrin-like domain
MDDARVAPRLRVPANRVSPRARVGWTAVAVGQAAVVLIVLGLLVGVWNVFDLPGWGWLAVVIAALAYAVTMPSVRYAVHRWEVTADAVFTQSGWLTQERRVAPLARVQTVDFEQGALARALRLATVTVTTASAAGPVRIEGLDRYDAENLVDDLTARANAHGGDAT